MLHTDTIDRLRAWEDRFPVLDWTVNGLQVWPLVRLQLSADLLAAGRPARPDAGRAGVSGVLRPLTRALARIRHHRSEVLRVTPVDALFLGRPANRQPIDGVWCERFYDPIADVLEADGLTSLHLEHGSMGAEIRLPRLRPSLVITGAVARREFRAAHQASETKALDGLDVLLREMTCIAPSTRVSRGWITRRARAIELVARYLGKVMQRARPRIVFCTVYYTVVGMALCLAARRRGIPAVDVQHGVTLGNPAYQGWSRFPDGGYASLPAWFWAWSDTDAEPVRRWPAAARPAHMAMIGGHPQVALWQSDHPQADPQRARIPARSGTGLTILVTLSWSSGFSELLQQVLRTSPADCQWWIRVHPLMDRERPAIRAWCARQLPGRSHVDQPTDLPLPLLLGAADLHLTHNSTVVQEAARLGIPSVLIDQRALDVYTEELRSGWAVFAGEPERILRALASQQQRRRDLVPLDPYPSWSAMTDAVRALMTKPEPCLATAPAASSPTPVRA